MLQNVSEAILDCYRRAEHCRRQAMELTDPAAKESFAKMEQRWIALAHSYEFSERLSRFNETARDKMDGR